MPLKQRNQTKQNEINSHPYQHFQIGFSYYLRWKNIVFCELNLCILWENIWQCLVFATLKLFFLEYRRVRLSCVSHVQSRISDLFPMSRLFEACNTAFTKENTFSVNLWKGTSSTGTGGVWVANHKSDALILRTEILSWTIDKRVYISLLGEEKTITFQHSNVKQINK